MVWKGPFSDISSSYCVSCFYNHFRQTNQSRSTMSLTSPVLCSSNDFSLYHVIWFLICYICCHQTNQISSMVSLRMMGLTPDSLVCTLFSIFFCILTIKLVVLVFLGLKFLYQQEFSTNVIFCVCCVRTDRSQVQRWLTYRNVLALKFLILFPNLSFKFGKRTNNLSAKTAWWVNHLWIQLLLVWTRKTQKYHIWNRLLSVQKFQTPSH